MTMRIAWGSGPGWVGKYAAMAMRTVRHHGIGEGVGRCIAEWSFDRRHGLSAFLPREVGPADHEPGFRQADAVQYQGVDPRLALEVVGALPDEVRRTATFVDYGCGKARGLAVGIVSGFRRLVGVEVSRELSVLAERNLQTLRRRHPGVLVEIQTRDAVRFEPPEGPLVVFLYNPFLGLTLERVVQRLERHAARWPVWVVYIHPLGRSAFVRMGFRERRVWGDSCAVLFESGSFPAVSAGMGSQRPECGVEAGVRP